MKKTKIILIIILLILVLLVVYIINRKNMQKQSLQDAQPVPTPEINLEENIGNENSSSFEYDQKTGEVTQKNDDTIPTNDEPDIYSSKNAPIE